MWCASVTTRAASRRACASGGQGVGTQDLLEGGGAAALAGCTKCALGLRQSPALAPGGQATAGRQVPSALRPWTPQGPWAQDGAEWCGQRCVAGALDGRVSVAAWGCVGGALHLAARVPARVLAAAAAHWWQLKLSDQHTHRALHHRHQCGCMHGCGGLQARFGLTVCAWRGTRCWTPLPAWTPRVSVPWAVGSRGVLRRVICGLHHRCWLPGCVL